eukprot:scaffold2041_cov110-Isochrysis_galbana.AAC.7
MEGPRPQQQQKLMRPHCCNDGGEKEHLRRGVDCCDSDSARRRFRPEKSRCTRLWSARQACRAGVGQASVTCGRAPGLRCPC